RLGGADSLKELRAGWRRSRDDVISLVSPVTRHLAPAGGGIDRRTNRFIQHFGGGYAEGQAESAIAVVRVEPIVGRLENHSRRCQNSFVARARNLEENLVLTLQLHFLVV